MTVVHPSDHEAPRRDVLLRQIIPSDMLEGVVNLPQGLENRLVEMILLPIEDKALASEEVTGSLSSLQRFSGAWHGEPLVREEQGAYEQRDNLE
jgi:CO dehydrogenase/acetyl-CoA synthase beta subunit